MADCNSIEALLNNLTAKIIEVENASNSRIDAIERGLSILQTAVNSLRSLVNEYGAAISRISQAIANLIDSFANQNKPKDGKNGRDGKDGKDGEKGEKGDDADNKVLFGLILLLQGQIAALAKTVAFLSSQVANLFLRFPRNGRDGKRGEKGDKGDKGDEGKRGEKGEQGKRGEKGDKGDEGKRGEKGEQGKRGEKGEQGKRGEKGIDGNNGRNGNQGQKGEQGKDGQVQIIKVPQIVEKVVQVRVPTITEIVKEVKTTEVITKAQDLSNVLAKIAELRSKLIYNSTVEILEDCEIKNTVNTKDLPDFLNQIENKLSGIEKIICQKEELESYDLGTFNESKTVNLAEDTRFVKVEVTGLQVGIGRTFSNSLNESDVFFFGSISFKSALGLSVPNDWNWMQSYFYPDSEDKPEQVYVFSNYDDVNYKITGYKVKP